MRSLLRALGLTLCLAALRPARAAEPLTVLDLAGAPDTAPGDAMGAWLQHHGWQVQFGTPAYFFIHDGALHLVARPGPAAGSLLPWKLMKREDKIILRVTPPGFHASPALLPHVEVTMAPLRLPGKGADVTDSDRNDACFYLLVAFAGPRHRYHGEDIADTVAYVWADGPWQSGAPVGSERKYGAFMRYIAIGRGADRLGQLRTLTRDLQADFRAAYPQRAAAATPDVVEIGLMIDSNTVKSEAASALRSVRLLP